MTILPTDRCLICDAANLTRPTLIPIGKSQVRQSPIRQTLFLSRTQCLEKTRREVGLILEVVELAGHLLVEQAQAVRRCRMCLEHQGYAGIVWVERLQSLQHSG